MMSLDVLAEIIFNKIYPSSKGLLVQAMENANPGKNLYIALSLYV